MGCRCSSERVHVSDEAGNHGTVTVRESSTMKQESSARLEQLQPGEIRHTPSIVKEESAKMEKLQPGEIKRTRDKSQAETKVVRFSSTVSFETTPVKKPPIHSEARKFEKNLRDFEKHQQKLPPLKMTSTPMVPVVPAVSARVSEPRSSLLEITDLTLKAPRNGNYIRDSAITSDILV